MNEQDYRAIDRMLIEKTQHAAKIQAQLDQAEKEVGAILFMVRNRMSEDEFSRWLFDRFEESFPAWKAEQLIRKYREIREELNESPGWPDIDNFWDAL